MTSFNRIWPTIDAVPGFLVPGQERWLYQAALTLPPNANIVEIGSFKGRSTVSMALACHGTKRTVYAIDSFKGNKSDFQQGHGGIEWEGTDFFDEFWENIEGAGVERHVRPVAGKSQDIGRFWTKSIDLIFFDGSHVRRDLLEDFLAFFPHVKPGGILAFHDVTPNWKGPMDVWRYHAGPRLIEKGNVGTLAFGVKPDSYGQEIFRVHKPILTRDALQNERPIGPEYEEGRVVQVFLAMGDSLQAAERTIRSLLKQTGRTRFEIVAFARSIRQIATVDELCRRFPFVLKGRPNDWATHFSLMDKLIRERQEQPNPPQAVLFIGSDIVPDENFVQELWNAACPGSKEQRAVGCSRRTRRGVTRPRAGQVIWDTAGNSAVFQIEETQAAEPTDVEVCDFSGFFVPTSLYMEIDGFRQPQGRFYGDIDFMLRLSRAGRPVRFLPNVQPILRARTGRLPDSEPLVGLRTFGLFAGRRAIERHVDNHSFNIQALSARRLINWFAPQAMQDHLRARLADRFPHVYIVMPVHNRRAETDRCLETVAQQDYVGRITTVVVNDGSSDGTQEMLSRKYPWVETVQGDGGLWWTGGVSAGIDHIRDRLQKNDYVMLLNNDSRLPWDAMRGLVRVGMSNPRSLIAARARTLDGDGLSVGGWVTWYPTFSKGFHGEDRYFDKDSHEVELDAVFGRATLVPARAIQRIKFDAKRFPQYWGDTDFSLRAKRAGFQVLATRRVTIGVHHAKSTTGTHAGRHKLSTKAALDQLTSLRSNDNLRRLALFVWRHAPRERRFQLVVGLSWRNIKRVVVRWRPVARRRKSKSGRRRDAHAGSA